MSDDDDTAIVPRAARDQKLRDLLDAARQLAELADAGSHLRAVAAKELETAAIIWAANQCTICGRRGDHEWDELTTSERSAHEAEEQRRS